MCDFLYAVNFLIEAPQKSICIHVCTVANDAWNGVLIIYLSSQRALKLGRPLVFREVLDIIHYTSRSDRFSNSPYLYFIPVPHFSCAGNNILQSLCDLSVGSCASSMNIGQPLISVVFSAIITLVACSKRNAHNKQLVSIVYMAYNAATMSICVCYRQSN